MKVYTKTGDRGKTSLFSGERISKSHDRVETYGEVDELNAFLGLFLSVLPDDAKKIRQEVMEIQHLLFTMGGWLATTPASPNIHHLSPMPENCVLSLEKSIDSMTETLPELKAFILPGGSQAGAYAHVARTVCRRVERHVIRLIEKEGIQNDTVSTQMEVIRKYLNRLSDYFFVAARMVNMLAGTGDVLYSPSGM